MKNINNSGRCPTEKRYRFLCDTAATRGLTLRQETDKGVKPRTFELVHRNSNSAPIRSGITRQEVTLDNNNTVLDLIMSYPEKV